MSQQASIINKAKSQLGIKEKGANNVKYNTEYYGRPVQGTGYAWCAVFIWWVFKECNLKKLYYGGGKTAYCPTLVSWFKQKKQWRKPGSVPKAGDIIFFDYNHNNSSDHVGIVESYNSSTKVVTTIEGNKRDAVVRQTYSLNHKDICGYGVPAYTDGAPKAVTTPQSKPQSSGKQTVTDLQKAINKTYNAGLVVDGVWGPKTEAQAKKRLLKVTTRLMNSAHVKWAQSRLIKLGYPCGSYGADSKYGAATKAAVQKFQRAKKISADGIVGINTTKKLI